MQSNSFAFDETAIGNGRKALKKYTAHKTTFIRIQIFCCICYFLHFFFFRSVAWNYLAHSSSLFCLVLFFFFLYCKCSFVVDTIHKTLFIRFTFKQQIKTINKIQAEQVWRAFSCIHSTCVYMYGMLCVVLPLYLYTLSFLIWTVCFIFYFLFFFLWTPKCFAVFRLFCVVLPVFKSQ